MVGARQPWARPGLASAVIAFQKDLGTDTGWQQIVKVKGKGVEVGWKMKRKSESYTVDIFWRM